MTTLEVRIPDKMLPFLTERKRNKVARGGRGSGKSWSVARLIILRMYQKRTRVLCVRQVQKSIKQSSHRLLCDTIEAMGLSAFFTITATGITGRNGSEVAYVGLQDHTADTLKSYENFDLAWCEEAHSISAYSANILIPTIRAPGSELWWTYNPDQETDFIHEMAERGDSDTLVVTINWMDNNWFPEELEGERVKLQRINQDLYDHVWGGKCRSVAGLLFKRHWFKRYPLGKHPAVLNKYIASDYAGGPDPDNPDSDPDWTEHGTWGLDHNGDLWAVDWWSGQEDPSVWITAWLALLKRWKPVFIAFEEKGVILRSVNGSINKAMQESQTFVQRTGLASAGNKASRALGFAARAAAGTVWIPECEWGDRLVNQLCAFNGQDGKRDDMVDVCSLIARGLDDMADARPPAPPRPDPPKPFTDAYWAAIDKTDAESEAAKARYYR